jgi:hypothetical protein
MAETTKELQGQLDAAQQVLNTAKKNLDNAPLLQRSFYQQGLDVAQAAFDKIKVRYDAAYKAEVGANQAAKDQLKAEQEARGPLLDRAQIEVNTARNYLTQYKNSKNTAKIAEYTTKLANAEAVLTAVENGAKGKLVKVPGTNRVEIVLEQAPGIMVPASSAEVRIADNAAQTEVGNRLESDKGLGEEKKIINKNGVQIVQTTHSDGTITETPASSAMAGTQVTTASTTTAAATTGSKTGAGKGGKTKAVITPVTPITDWEADLRKWVPSKAWMLELDRTKYPQLFTLLKTASEQKYYESEQGQQRFLNELDATDYFKELADSSQRRDIKKLVGDLGFDSTDFSKFVSDSINFGWEGETLKAKTYEEVFRRNIDGSYANPTAVTRAKKSNDYLRVQLTAKSYFNNASQESVERVLTGTVTNEDFARQQRTIAKQTYGHLSELIDQGVTLEDLATNYKSSAAKLLEIDPNAIDMSQGDFEIALSYGEEGQKRTMTTGEWEKMLRTDPRYGWEKTNNAKTEARALASNIAQAFGKII